MIFRIRKNSDNPYVMVNKGFIYDSNLSAKAKGILLYLLSRPDDWQVHEWEMLEHFSDGRDSIRAGVKELINSKYLQRSQNRTQEGKFTSMHYDVFESPMVSNQITADGKTVDGKSDTTNIDYTNTEDLFRTLDKQDSLDELHWQAQQAMLKKDIKKNLMAIRKIG